MLGKIIDGVLTYPPHRIVIDGMQIFNPTETQLISVGYKLIVETDMPDDAPEGQHYEAHYTDGETEITQSWVLVEDVEEEKPVTLEQRVTQLEQNIAGVIQIATM
ncbi:hypothetical protein [[Ruminococcus] torques]|uniref:hypothetical protein n=1 Tax=[Ruminococcus] torques TaxID=33039 RepID=UPI0025A45ED5|nr:hypothetical protein [[Ruminococcus] torques]MDM8237142.1 hypothetical protein [[Ruminococcus] torques]